MGRCTPLHDLHLAAGARMVDFGGWAMPLAYGSQIEEHHAVRRAAGVFDVSHMGIIDLAGSGARALLRGLLANDVARLTGSGGALYSCMLNDSGGIRDDLIVYASGAEAYRLVVNAATRDQDLAWIAPRAAAAGVRLIERTELAMLAVQGPEARAHVAALLPAAPAEAALALPVFHALRFDTWCVARTGYTGEDGFEVLLPAAAAADLWRALLARGVRPCGLGARDTLRLEAGLNLYGNDMDETTHPLESGLAWTVAFEPADRDFTGRAALEAARARGPQRRFVGLLLEDRAIMRPQQRVRLADGGEGRITSGTFSPTLQRSIAFARLPPGDAQRAEVEVRGRWLPAQVVRFPFVRHGRALV
ncbi:MAG: glycine cleavage system aminomethyltransferase GcvT [Gammaproteobacteria bacterium]|nr:glycine cleavage system aminomethyltransferase GcvT [Gammaproteobacteria bacterium]